MSDYGYTVEVPQGYDEAVLRARLAMKGEGFSIISEMHVGGMLGPDAGDQRQYLIMGVWNAPVSHRHIDSQLQAAVHLPCNVVVQEVDSGAIVAALDPVDTVEEADERSRAAATLARDALERMLRLVAAGSG
ncbi:MAG: DUF302 domain-containing protein [Actinomycetota bacterium]|nr:DUF302 domain-containing protein [Actinomycetota bacterium]